MKLVCVCGAILSLVVAGCGGPHRALRAPVITARQWGAVVNDVLDNGRIDSRWTCGAVVEAVAHLELMSPPSTPAFRRSVPLMHRYARGVCPRDAQLGRIAVGMTDAEVAALAGMPRTPGLRCWSYPSAHGRSGRRVCFDRGRVARVQISVHG